MGNLFVIPKENFDDVVLFLITERQMSPDQAIEECIQFPSFTWYRYQSFLKGREKM